jgi:hypothetical protein
LGGCRCLFHSGYDKLGSRRISPGAMGVICHVHDQGCNGGRQRS